MNLEKIYNELKEINNELQVLSIKELMDKMEVEIRKQNCYKTTSKTRVNAIKRVASKLNIRPALTGYGIRCGYQVVTDSYHLIAIHQDNMPLPLVATMDELKEMGIDYQEYTEKYGKTSLINGSYPNMDSILKYDSSNEIPMIDLNDLESFIKLHKKDKELYQIGTQKFQAQYVKNVIDVLGTDVKIYYQGEIKPLFFVNDKDELGLVLPVKVY